MRNPMVAYILSSLVALSSGSVFAQALNPSLEAQPPAPETQAPASEGGEYLSRIEVQNQNGISYFSGGVGEVERARLDKAARDFNLKVVMALKNGDYLTDAAVLVTDLQGNRVLELPSQGPWFYAKLPPGTYNVSVSTGGETQQKRVSVAATEQQVVHFYW